MKICCVRHGKPEFQYPKGTQILSAAEFNALLDSYDSAGLDERWNPRRAASIRLTGYAVSSDLPRAQETALLISGGPAALISPLYREVPLPRFQKQDRKLPGALFMTLSRLGWYLGVMPCAESRRETQRRIVRAADELEDLCSQEKEVCLYAHGFFLWLLGGELRRRKWKSAKRGPYRYLETAWFIR